MTKDDLVKLSKLAFENGIDAFTLICALHWGADTCEDPELAKSYGTRTQDGLRELRESIK